MAGVEAVRVLSVLDEAAEGLKCGLCLHNSMSWSCMQYATVVYFQVTLILDSGGFKVFRSAGWGTWTGEQRSNLVTCAWTTCEHCGSASAEFDRHHHKTESSPYSQDIQR